MDKPFLLKMILQQFFGSQKLLSMQPLMVKGDSVTGRENHRMEE